MGGIQQLQGRAHRTRSRASWGPRSSLQSSTAAPRCETWTWHGWPCAYEVSGSGPAIVVSHGFGSGSKHFRRLSALLVAEGFKVYAPDYLGFGASCKPQVAYTPILWAQQLDAFLREVVQEEAVVIGNSIGSQVATVAAHDSPGRVKALLLLNVAAGMNQRGLYDDDPTLRNLKPVFLLIEFLLKQPLVARFLFNSFRSKANVERILRDQVYLRPEAVTPELVDLLYEPSEDPGALGCFVEVFTGDPGPRPDLLAPQLKCPVKLIWGLEDRWTPVDGTVANAFKRLAGACSALDSTRRCKC